MSLKIAQVGEAILQTPAIQVTEFHAELKTFVADLKDTLVQASGVGIAAPQVFDPRAVLIIASKPNKRYPDAPDMEPLVMINPSILSQSETTNQAWEGCLSVPGLRGLITRSNQVEVAYYDIDGNPQRIELSGFVARIFLHEYDHLIGQTWLDHISSSNQVMAESLWLQNYAK